MYKKLVALNLALLLILGLLPLQALAVAVEMTLGQIVSQTIEHSDTDTAEFSFTPDEDGYYAFKRTDGATWGSLKIYDPSSQLLGEVQRGEYTPKEVTMQLRKGNTYIVKLVPEGQSKYNPYTYQFCVNYKEIGELEKCLQRPSTTYDNELALIAAKLSLKSYDNNCSNDESVRGYLTHDLGFKDENIHSRNYGEEYAFTIATKEYDGADADEIIVIVAQGTTAISEFIKDYSSKLDHNNERFYGGYAPYQVVSQFYAEIVNHDYANPVNLYSLTKQNKRYKILVTGHSLGGAVANLLAAQLTSGRHIGGVIGESEVFCYTFAAIDSIDVDSPVVEGYENIHNVYNEMDTLSPSQYGKIIKSGMGSRNGKFGVIEPFEYDYRTEEERGRSDVEQMIDAVNHSMSNYLEAVESHKVEKSPLRGQGALDLTTKSHGYSVVACPVDVDVYSEGELVGRVVNNIVDNSVTTIDIIVDDDVKFIVYPDERQYELRLTGYDEGTMVYYTQDLTGAKQVKTIANVNLVEDKKMNSKVGGEIEAPYVKLYVMNESDDRVLEVKSDGTEVPFILTGDVNSDGKVNNTDRLILARYLAGVEDYADKVDMEAANVNDDGDVNNVDRLILARYLAGVQGYMKYFS